MRKSNCVLTHTVHRMCSAVGGSRVNYRLSLYFVVLLFFNAPKGNERANASRHPEPANFYSYFMAINFFAVTLFLSRDAAASLTYSSSESSLLLLLHLERGIFLLLFRNISSSHLAWHIWGANALREVVHVANLLPKPFTSTAFLALHHHYRHHPRILFYNGFFRFSIS